MYKCAFTLFSIEYITKQYKGAEERKKVPIMEVEERRNSLVKEVEEMLNILMKRVAKKRKVRNKG